LTARLSAHPSGGRITGGRIDRTRRLDVTFDGKPLTGFAGNTLASALLATGTSVLARSSKYHRLRGIMAAGSEEPNVLVSVRCGGRQEHGVPATLVELAGGLEARSLNAARQSGLGSWTWNLSWLRGALGSGTAQPSPGWRMRTNSQPIHAFTDVLVVGGGPAGLSAALAAGTTGARVVLAERTPWLGGALLDEPAGKQADAWIAKMSAALAAMPNVRTCTRTTVVSATGAGQFGLIEASADQPGQVILLRAAQTVLATGAAERMIPFGNNDRPGIMLASAVLRYLNHFAVLAGRTVVLFTDNDSAYATAFDLKAAGASITIVDARQQPGAMVEAAAKLGIEVLTGHAVAGAEGRHRVSSLVVSPFDQVSGSCGAGFKRLACELLAVSGGYDPRAELAARLGVSHFWNERLACFVPNAGSGSIHLAGAVTGTAATLTCIAQGHATGAKAAVAAGALGNIGDPFLPDGLAGYDASNGSARIWRVLPPKYLRPGKRFASFRHDVLAPDKAPTHPDGDFGAGPFNFQTLPSPDVIALAAAAQPEAAPHRSPADRWAERRGAVFVDIAFWRRAACFPRAGEDAAAACRREARHVRQTAGITDISDLGKFDIQGPDAFGILDRALANGMGALEIGGARHGVLVDDNGAVICDAVLARLAPDHYFATVAAPMAGRFEARLAMLGARAEPQLRVHLTSVTDQWAAMAVAGPAAKRILAEAIRDIDFLSDRFPRMAVRQGNLGDIPLRVHRISYSGELAYEVYCPAGFAEACCDFLTDYGRRHGLTPFGASAADALRIEKGHPSANEIDGRRSAVELGLLPGGIAAGGRGLIGLRPVDRSLPLSAGMVLFPRKGSHRGPGLGDITSAAFSPALGHHIALGFALNADGLRGQLLDAAPASGRSAVAVQVVPPCQFDPGGARLHG